jgi:hypothetical protein
MPPHVVPVARRAARRARDFAIDTAGGRARMRVVLTLAAVLGLSGADTGTVSADGPLVEPRGGVTIEAAASQRLPPAGTTA